MIPARPGRQVYLVEARNGLVKIGVSYKPALRETTINLHSPVPCRLIAQWIGDGFEERKLHKRFSAHRSHNEWFVIGGELRAFVEEVRGRGLEAVRTWDDVTEVGAARMRVSISERLSIAAKAAWDDERRARHAETARETHRRRRAQREALQNAVKQRTAT